MYTAFDGLPDMTIAGMYLSTNSHTGSAKTATAQRSWRRTKHMFWVAEVVQQYRLHQQRLGDSMSTSTGHRRVRRVDRKHPHGEAAEPICCYRLRGSCEGGLPSFRSTACQTEPLPWAEVLHVHWPFPCFYRGWRATIATMLPYSSKGRL